ncbi:MAG: NAD(P)-binding domain-containing protein [Flavobacteriales bacterium]|nr:NAD(P)-binding domain-containing protein [Flavobacteriales bacterium]
MKDLKVGVIGAGSMGSGIAQVAAQAGHRVWLNDSSADALEQAAKGHSTIFSKLAEKGKMTLDEAKACAKRISYTRVLDDLKSCGLVVEAIIEDLEIKQGLFQELEMMCAEDAVLATNTSSLPIVAISGKMQNPGRMMGLHFFNPAPLMPLVEIVPSMLTAEGLEAEMTELMRQWGKVPVLAKDTPGFIVNRVARPFYGESLRLLEEGIADEATIDHALRTYGGFRMGPFELMDLIGNDINFAVTSSVFAAFFNDGRYRPSIIQQRMVEAGLLGRKSGKGYYDYADDTLRPEPDTDEQLGTRIVDRVLCNLINQAIDAVYLGIASPKDIDLAMTKGVNYPKGLLQWGNEVGLGHVLNTMDALFDEYHEERYRASALLRRMVREGRSFF